MSAQSSEEQISLGIPIQIVDLELQLALSATEMTEPKHSPAALRAMSQNILRATQFLLYGSVRI